MRLTTRGENVLAALTALTLAAVGLALGLTWFGW